MSRPVVTVVGRPNVGKSSIFNKLLGRRKALVQDIPGVTRDRNYANATLDGRDVILCDTGGFEESGVVTGELVARLVRDQALIAIDEADVIVFVMDIRDGLTSTDRDIAQRLRTAHQPVIFVLNKCDHPKAEIGIAEFYELGIDSFLLTSAEHDLGLGELVESIAEQLPARGEERGVVPEPWDDKRARRGSRRDPGGRLQFLGDDMPSSPSTQRGPEPDEWDPRPEPEEPEEPEGPHFEEGVVLDEDGVEVHYVGGGPADLRPSSLDDEEGVPEELPEFLAPEGGAFTPRIAVLGRPNVGKSTLVNRLLGYKRSITSPVAGTTHDPVDAALEHDGRSYVLIDMPGLRKKRRIHEPLEKMMAGRAVRTVEAAHLCLLVIDGSEGVTEQEAKLGKLTLERGRALVILVNKWDLMPKGRDPREHFMGQLRRRFPHLAYADVLFLSALSGRGVHRLWDAIARADDTHRLEVRTAPLNRWLQAVITDTPPPMHKHRPVRIYYGVQTGIRPPTFQFFCRMPHALSDPYRRFLVRQFRAAFPAAGTPIRFQFRDREGK